ncbi:MAG: Holliday junction resolvase RuvX [Roseiarcus sp.]
MSSRPLTLGSLAALLPKKARLIGVDLGAKTIGLALSDVERRIATPLVTIERKKFTADAQQLSAEIARFEAFALIVGLPLNMNGEEGPRAQATRAFLRNFSARDPTPFALWDERLSTAAVNRALIEQDVSRARRAAVVDRMAAAYILQGALDRLAAIGAEAFPAPSKVER